MTNAIPPPDGREGVPPPSYPLHCRMSRGAFDALPREEGWNFAYRNGYAHVTPARILVEHVLDLDAAGPPPPLPEGLVSRPPRARDSPAIAAAFVPAFAPTIDFAGFGHAELEDYAHRYLERFFSRRNARLAARSCLAVDRRVEMVAAAALLNRTSAGEPLLDGLFVGPGWQRAGIARHVALKAFAALADCGETIVVSRVVVGNHASAAWHHTLGFIPRPNPIADAHRRALGARA